MSEAASHAIGAPSTPVVLEVDHVWKRYCRVFKLGLAYTAADLIRDAFGLHPSSAPKLRQGEFWSVRDVSFEARQGDCLGIIGANGAGKTTLLRLLNGIMRPDAGQIRIRGRVGALIEIGAGFHPLLNGRENVYINGTILGMTRRELFERYDSIAAFAGLEPQALAAPVKTYSSGMLVRLGFSVAIHCQPDILLIDEILAVGDMSFQAKCLNALGDLRKKGATVILVSHNLNHIAGWADRVIALDHGAVLAAGTPEETIQKYTDFVNSRDTSGAAPPRAAHGTGRCYVREVQVLNHDGNPIRRARTGEPITIALSVECREALDDVEVDLKIFDGIDRLRCGASSRYVGKPLALPTGLCRIEATYPALPLNSGAFRPSIAVWRAGRSELMDWYEGTPIPIEGMAASQGDVWWPPAYRVRSPP